MHRDVPLNEIVDNPFQPRSEFDATAIRSLADEIKAEGFWNGTLQGRRNARGQVELVFGHRRLRALKLLKVPSARVEILDLTDAQMSLRALAENLQREGLTDLEKSDAVKRTVEIERARRKANGEPERGAIQVVADRLGLAAEWVGTLCNISLSMDRKERDVIEAGHLTAKTAHAAKQWGGSEYVQTLARQGKDRTRSKPTHTTVAAMRSAVNAAPEPIREKLKEEVVAGKLERPDQVEARARRLASDRVRREKEPPPDLRVVILDWTDELKGWNTKLKTVAPYMDYVDEVPSIANRFRGALEQLIDTAKELLKEARR